MNHLHLHPAQITTDNPLHNHIQPPHHLQPAPIYPNHPSAGDL